MYFHANTIFEKVNEISSDNAILRTQLQMCEDNSQLSEINTRLNNNIADNMISLNDMRKTMDELRERTIEGLSGEIRTLGL